MASLTSQKNNDSSLNPPNDSKGKTAPNEISFPDDSDAPWIPPGQASLSIDLLAGDLFDFEKLLSQDVSGKTLSSIPYGHGTESLLLEEPRDKDDDSLTSFLDKLLNKPQNSTPTNANGTSQPQNSSPKLPPIPAHSKSDGALPKVETKEDEHTNAQPMKSSPKFPPLPSRPKSDGALPKVETKEDDRNTPHPQKSGPQFPALRAKASEELSKVKDASEDEVHDTVEFGGEDEKLLDERNASELPADIRDFEGTNEIYIQSGMFDNLLGNEEIAKLSESIMDDLIDLKLNRLPIESLTLSPWFAEAIVERKREDRP